MPRFLFFLTGLFLFNPAMSQEEDSIDSGDDKEHFRHLRISTSIGHTYLPRDTRVGKDIAILPSFGLDLEYWFNERIGLGLHNDLELLIFHVKEEEDLIIERDYPVLITLDLLVNVYKGLTVYIGHGAELERTQNFSVTRFGIEYEIPIRNGWDVYPVFFHDVRRNAYDTFSFGLGIGKRF